MKKIFLALTALLLISAVSSAQGLYLRVGGTYGMPVGTATVGSKYIYAE